MRVFRDSDDHDDDPSRKPIDPHDIEGQADRLADEIEDWLTDVDDAVNETSTAASEPAATSARPTTAVEPDEQVPAPVQTGSSVPAPAGSGPRTRARIFRASAASSSVVVTLAALAATGQPAPVTVPVAVYGLGWIAYLCWNAAQRPSPSLALAALTERRAARAQRTPH